MSKEPQPAKKSYFFGKGYADVGNTIKGAWQRNFQSIVKFKDNIVNAYNAGHGKVAMAFLVILNVLAMVSVIVFGSIITAVVSVINIVVVMVMMIAVYIGFSLIWLTDRIYLEKNKIFTACHECKEKSLIPTYIAATLKVDTKGRKNIRNDVI